MKRNLENSQDNTIIIMSLKKYSQNSIIDDNNLNPINLPNVLKLMYFLLIPFTI